MLRRRVCWSATPKRTMRVMSQRVGPAGGGTSCSHPITTSLQLAAISLRSSPRLSPGAYDTVATTGSWHVQPNAVNSGGLVKVGAVWRNLDGGGCSRPSQCSQLSRGWDNNPSVGVGVADDGCAPHPPTQPTQPYTHACTAINRCRVHHEDGPPPPPTHAIQDTTATDIPLLPPPPQCPGR